MEKCYINLDSLKYLRMVILSLPHLIFSKITVLVPYITVFRIPGRLFIYLPELFTCDPWMKLECKRECPFTQNSKVQLKEWPLMSLDMGRAVSNCRFWNHNLQIILWGPLTGCTSTVSSRSSPWLPLAIKQVIHHLRLCTIWSCVHNCSVVSDSFGPFGL